MFEACEARNLRSTASGKIDCHGGREVCEIERIGCACAAIDRSRNAAAGGDRERVVVCSSGEVAEISKGRPAGDVAIVLTSHIPRLNSVRTDKRVVGCITDEVLDRREGRAEDSDRQSLQIHGLSRCHRGDVQRVGRCSTRDGSAERAASANCERTRSGSAGQILNVAKLIQLAIHSTRVRRGNGEQITIRITSDRVGAGSTIDITRQSASVAEREAVVACPTR